MNSNLNLIHAQSRERDLALAAVRFQGPIRKLGAGAAVTVRAAQARDAQALRRLAALDDQPLPQAPLLIGEVGSRPLAALSLTDRRVVADPFVPTTEVVAMLRLRARQLRAPRRLALARLTRLRPI